MLRNHTKAHALVGEPHSNVVSEEVLGNHAGAQTSMSGVQVNRGEGEPRWQEEEMASVIEKLVTSSQKVN